MKSYEQTKCIYDTEKEFEWRKWQKEIPYVSFHPDWLVRAIPPLHGAVVRYNIKHKDAPDSFVSIYLDCYEALGYFGEPYWEVYPLEGDVYRCAMNETDKLIAAIDASLKEQMVVPANEQKDT